MPSLKGKGERRGIKEGKVGVPAMGLSAEDLKGLEFDLDTVQPGDSIGGFEVAFVVEAGAAGISDSDSDEPQIEGDSQENPSAALPWGPMQDAMLTAFIADDQNWGGPELLALAKRLKTTLEEVEMIFDQTDPDEWELKRFEKLLEIEAMKLRGFNWDRLEHATLVKLGNMVETGKVKTTAELLAVARVANQATRRGSGVETLPPGAGGSNMNVQLNVFGQSAPNGITDSALPGPGSLGAIRLSLSPTTIRQLSEGRVIDGEAQRLSDRIEMLTSEDVPELSKLADET